MNAAPPGFGDVLLAVLAAVLGCVGGAFALRSGYRSRNWFAYLCALGCAAFVAGVAGQRTFPSPDAVKRLGQSAAQSSAPGPWDAGVTIPVVGIHATPVAIGGLLAAAVGLSLLLLFERVAEPRAEGWTLARRLDDDDAV